MAGGDNDKLGSPSKAALGVVILLLTLAAAGAGLAVGSLLEFPAGTVAKAPAEPAAPDETSKTAASNTAEQAGGDSQAEVQVAEKPDLKVVPFPPVLTTLAEPKGTWIRIEGSMLLTAETEGKPEVLVEEAGTHLLAYLRTVKLAQIEGPSGFLHFREDMNEVVSTLSSGQVQEVLIHSMVVE